MIFQSLEIKVLKAKNDPKLLEKLIASNEGFIKKCMMDQQKASGALIDDEVTVAMLAFVEAVKQYDTSKGKFISFARLVINRRMVDEYRRLLRQNPFGGNSLDETSPNEENNQHPYEIAASVEAYEKEVKQRNLQMEIVLFEEGLLVFELSFKELIEVSPKQEAIKDVYQRIAKWLVSEPELLKRLYTDKKMPIIEILNQFEIDRKKIERGRKYILAMVVLLSSDLDLIKNYLERR